jgi:hypothetical protein
MIRKYLLAGISGARDRGGRQILALVTARRPPASDRPQRRRSRRGRIALGAITMLALTASCDVVIAEPGDLRAGNACFGPASPATRSSPAAT